MIEDVVLESEINVLIEMGDYYSKEIIMESELEQPVPTTVDSVSKLHQFINWVKRCIKTILAKINHHRLNKHIKDITSKDLDGREYRIDASIHRTLNELTGMNGRTRVNQYGFNYKFGNETKFDKKEGKLYQQRADYLMSHRFQPFEHSGTKKTLSSEELRKYVLAIGESTMNIADRLVKIQDHINDTKFELSEEDRKSEAFQQYVRMLTFELSNDLKIVQFVNKFFDMVKLFSKKASDDDVVELDDSDDSEESETSSSDNPDASSDGSSEPEKKFPPKTKYEIKNSLVKKAVDKFVFSKHSKCDAIYAKLQPDGDTLLVQYDTKDGKDNDLHEYKFSVNKYKHEFPWSMVLKTIGIDKVMKQITGGVAIKR